MKRMSFALTERQLLDGSKDVTRRKGWLTLKPGDRLLAVDKAMGLKKGEHSRVLGTIEIVSVRRECLLDITNEDVAREGFPEWDDATFVAMFIDAMGGRPDQFVSRIEFRKLST